MVDALYTGDLDLAAVTTPAELATLLRTVHLRADRPSLRVLEARTRHHPTPLSKTVVSEMLKGARFPRKAVMTAFLRACGERDDRLEAWWRAWDRLAAHRQDPAPSARDLGPVPVAQAAAPAAVEPSEAGAAEAERLRAEISRLNEDNRKLRLQIGAIGQAGQVPETQSDEARSGSVRGPGIRRRELAAQLRSLRTERGMTIEQVAAHLFCSAGKVRRMENGFRSGTLRDVRDLCEFYGLSGDRRDHLMELAQQSKQHGWWQGYDYPFSTYIGLEQDAASIRSFECVVVPGLLQTADYAYAVVNAAGQGRLSSEAIDRRVQIRLTRQRVLTRSNPPEFWAVIDEAVLHRLVGGPIVMAAQLDQIIEFSRLENVNVAVIPSGAGYHPGMSGSFTMLEFDGGLPGIVSIEGMFGVAHVEKPSEVDRYNEAFRELRAIALDQENSGKKIMRIRRALQRSPGGP